MGKTFPALSEVSLHIARSLGLQMVMKVPAVPTRSRYISQIGIKYLNIIDRMQESPPDVLTLGSSTMKGRRSPL